MGKLVDLSSHSTALVIAHRLSTTEHADEIIVLSEGTIAERGQHAQLLALGGHYASLWQVQQSSVGIAASRCFPVEEFSRLRSPTIFARHVVQVDRAGYQIDHKFMMRKR